MQLFYTTTTGYDNEQPNVQSSLGGYKSSTPVTNDDFDNLFGEISVMTIRSGRDEYRAIMLKNTMTTTARKVKVSVAMPEDSIAMFRMAVGKVGVPNKYGYRSMENVPSIYSKPFQAQFKDMVDGAVLEVGDLASGGEIGLWVCRHIDAEKAREQYNLVCEPDPTDPTARRFRPVAKSKTETIDITISWV